MSGFTVTVERELLEDAEDVHGVRPLQIWQPPIELKRDFHEADGETYEAWRAVTSASAYPQCLGSDPADALRQFARAAARVFGETGTAPDIQWVASVDAPAYEDGMGRTMPAALTSLAKTFDRVYGDRNDDRSLEADQQ